MRTDREVDLNRPLVACRGARSVDELGARALYFCALLVGDQLKFLFLFQAEDGIRDFHVTGVQTCALPIWPFLPLHRASLPPALGGRRGLGIYCRSEEHTSELQSRENLVCRLLLEKKK